MPAPPSVATVTTKQAVARRPRATSATKAFTKALRQATPKIGVRAGTYAGIARTEAGATTAAAATAVSSRRAAGSGRTYPAEGGGGRLRPSLTHAETPNGSTGSAAATAARNLKVCRTKDGTHGFLRQHGRAGGSASPSATASHSHPQSNPAGNSPKLGQYYRVPARRRLTGRRT